MKNHASVGAAVALYLYRARLGQCGFGGRGDGRPFRPMEAAPHFEGAYQAPNNWVEALYFFTEALRCAP